MSLIFFIVAPKQTAIMEKATTVLLSKETTEKDRSFKTQMILTTTDQSEKATEAIWQKMVTLVTKNQILT